MLNFKEFLSESRGLSIWDIDETLFKTTAKVNVVKNGEVIKQLDNKEFNIYKLKSGESFDFTEFKDAKHFRDTSEPIVRAIRKLVAMHKNIKAKGSKVIIITARSDFDNRDVFLDTFRRQGIDIDDIHVHRAGNLQAKSSAAAKKIIIKQYLNSGNYTHARLFDDAVSNLKMFKGLKSEYPDMTFEAYLAHENGKFSRY